MSGIKYYQLTKGEELPDEFCAVRDINGEPSEYTWYERMSEFERELWVQFNQSDWFAGSEYRKLQADNAKLREMAEKTWKAAEMLCQAWEGPCHADGVSIKPPCPLGERDELCVYGLIQRDLRELGVEVPNA